MDGNGTVQGNFTSFRKAMKTYTEPKMISNTFSGSKCKMGCTTKLQMLDAGNIVDSVVYGISVLVTKLTSSFCFNRYSQIVFYERSGDTLTTENPSS